MSTIATHRDFRVISGMISQAREVGEGLAQGRGLAGEVWGFNGQAWEHCGNGRIRYFSSFEEFMGAFLDVYGRA